MVQQVHDHLQVPLRLHESAHNTERSEEVAGVRFIPIFGGVRREPRDDRVVRPLARADAVGVRGVQAEAVATILRERKWV